MKVLSILLILTAVSRLHSAVLCHQDDKRERTALFIEKLLAYTISPEYVFVINSTNMVDVLEIKNCLAYVTCEPLQIRVLDGDQIEFKIALGPDELASLPSKCGYINKYSDLPGSKVLESNTNPPQLIPPTNKKQSVEKLTRLLEAGKLTQAAQEAFNNWGIEMGGYKLKFGGVDTGVGQTAHDLKEVRLGSAHLKSPCSFLKALRHEAEHISQFNRADVCKREGKSSTFEDHTYREIMAYTSDLKASKEFCNNTNLVIINAFTINKINEYLDRLNK